jgi:hypothetical protein
MLAKFVKPQVNPDLPSLFILLALPFSQGLMLYEFQQLFLMLLGRQFVAYFYYC